MGYQVYEDVPHDRWAGYGVPAICDHPDCTEEIDRGLAYKCETHWGFDDDNNNDEEAEGCGLFFCEPHRSDSDNHDQYSPKPDTPEWIRHMLTDDTWDKWRRLNTEKVESLSRGLAQQDH